MEKPGCFQTLEITGTPGSAKTHRGQICEQYLQLHYFFSGSLIYYYNMFLETTSQIRLSKRRLYFVGKNVVA